MINFKRFQESVKILLNPSIAIGEKRIRVLLNLNNEKLLYAICASSQLNILQSNAFLRKHLIPGTNIFQLKKLAIRIFYLTPRLSLNVWKFK